MPTYKKIDCFLKFIQNTPEINTITLLGGEPLLHKAHIQYFLDKLQTINLSRKRKIHCTIFTNGTKYIDLKKYRRLIRIIITLNGSQELHDIHRKYRGTNKSSYNDVIANSRKYAADGFSLQCYSVVEPKTIKQIIPSIQQLLQQDAPFKNINIATDHFALWNKHLFSLIKLHYDILKINRQYNKQIIKPQFAGLGTMPNTAVCLNGSVLYGIDLINGTIHSCPENNGSKKDILGNISQKISTNIIHQGFIRSNLRLYHYQYLPKIFSLWLFKKFNIKICPMRNQYHCKNNFIIPIYQLCLAVLAKYYIYSARNIPQ